MIDTDTALCYDETMTNGAPSFTEPGVYVLANFDIVKVQQNRAKTRVYAMVWEAFDGTRLNLNSEVVHGHWEYEPGLIYYVKPEYRMTVEQAKEFTLKYGQCAKCGRTLKAAQSVLDGIGPVCIKSFRA